MSRLTLLSLQLLVAVVALAMWHVLTTVPVFGRILLPPFFFASMAPSLNEDEVIVNTACAFALWPLYASASEPASTRPPM